MDELVNKTVSVVTSDGRNMMGILQGFDQTSNIILTQCTQNVYIPGQRELEQIPLGSYIIRGTSVTFIGEVDQEKFLSLKIDPALAVGIKSINNR
ncbi:U6 snRNA-associated Sm-like protein LSm8 [Acrasis kona]|uniref:U6 snRNA-associated Sm-like protein LSm8 n=1 Tax=Acrasis kona TaxID=1008807 RepID=A0AAW2Z276_9EUKA